LQAIKGDAAAAGGTTMNGNYERMRGWRKVLDYTPFPDLRGGLRERWQASQRPGIYRLVPPWVWRHPRFFGLGHIIGGLIQAGAGLICLSYGVYGWAAFFLVIAALNLAGGAWYLTLDRPAQAHA
jgi:hypothetical protein